MLNNVINTSTCKIRIYARQPHIPWHQYFLLLTQAVLHPVVTGDTASCCFSVKPKTTRIHYMQSGVDTATLRYPPVSVLFNTKAAVHDRRQHGHITCASVASAHFRLLSLRSRYPPGSEPKRRTHRHPRSYFLPHVLRSFSRIV